MSTSRFMWEECFGEIPERMVVCHRCDNTKCINPEHLFLGTQHDNVMDAVKKGRWYKTYLPDEAIRDIRTGGSPSVMGKKYGIPAHTVDNIRRGRSYAWLV